MPEPPARDSGSAVESNRPVNLDLRLGEQMLRITWADGVTSELDAVFLRKHCPCAACRTERDKQAGTLLPILTSAPSARIRLNGGHLVGHYALQLDWSDGHNTGIYDFTLLRSYHGRGEAS